MDNTPKVDEETGLYDPLEEGHHQFTVQLVRDKDTPLDSLNTPVLTFR
jgi:hypothetical protein